MVVEIEYGFGNGMLWIGVVMEDALGWVTAPAAAAALYPN